MNNNKGFTMIELLVAIGILGIITVSITAFMSSSARNYNTMYNSLNVQYTSQLSMAQMQEYIIDCNGAIAQHGNGLLVINKNDDGTKTLHLFEPRDGTLFYGTDTGSDNSVLAGITAADTMSSDLAGFVVTMGSIEDDEISSLDVQTTYERDGKAFTTEQTIALRNKPLCNPSLTTEELLDTLDTLS